MRHPLALLVLLLPSAAQAELVEVRGRGEIDLRHFVCDVVPNSAIRRVCYDEANRYMVVLFGGSVFLQFCDIEPQKVYGMIHAGRPSKFFAEEIRRRYSCSSGNTPRYP